MEINVSKFLTAMKEQNINARIISQRMQEKHKAGNYATIRTWIAKGEAREDTFSLCVDCLNEFESEKGWIVRKLAKYSVDYFRK